MALYGTQRLGKRTILYSIGLFAFQFWARHAPVLPLSELHSTTHIWGSDLNSQDKKIYIHSIHIQVNIQVTDIWIYFISLIENCSRISLVYSLQFQAWTAWYDFRVLLRIISQYDFQQTFNPTCPPIPKELCRWLLFVTERTGYSCQTIR